MEEKRIAQKSMSKASVNHGTRFRSAMGSRPQKNKSNEEGEIAKSVENGSSSSTGLGRIATSWGAWGGKSIKSSGEGRTEGSEPSQAPSLKG